MQASHKQSDNCVFVAHDPEDAQDAHALVMALEQAGLSVWVGARDADPTSPGYAAELQSAAGRCASFVLPVGSRPLNAQPLGELTRIAAAAGRPIYPVRVSEHAAPPPFPALAGAKAWIDATGPQRDENLRRLAAELQSLPPPPPTPYGAAQPAAASAAWSTQPAAPSGGKRILLVVAGVIMVLAGLAQIARGLGAFDRSSSSPSSYVAPQATTAPMSTGTGTTVYDIWMRGKWGLSGTNCTEWIYFVSGGTVSDNLGETGTWSLNAMSQTLTLNRAAGTSQVQVTRSGETLILLHPSGRQEWQRCA
ncbi:MAG TPA: TIR domain-containing protein [Allosphingosinicella sp.]